MNLFRRLTRTPAAARLVPYPLPGGGLQQVRGESYYQKELRSVTRGMRLPTVRGDNWNASVRMTASLVPEPRNRHDRSAVRVEIMGQLVGYLPAEDAPGYQRLLLQLKREGKVATCEARLMIVPGIRNIAVYLHLAPAEDVAFALRTPDDCVPILGERTVTVTGEEAHQAVLRRLASREPWVVAGLGFCTIGKGKYAGQQAIEVRIGGEVVGQLTRTMTERYEQIVTEALNTGRTPVCKAMLSKDAGRGMQVVLVLPRQQQAGG